MMQRSATAHFVTMAKHTRNKEEEGEGEKALMKEEKEASREAKGEQKKVRTKRRERINEHRE